jgi:hypothetical protein
MSTSLPLSDLARGPAVKFEKIGDKVAGKILAVKREQQRDFDTGKPLVWDNGDPRLQTVIMLQTADGEQTLFAKGGKFEVAEGEGLAMENAIVAAVRAAGGSAIDPGAELAVAQTGYAKPQRAGMNPAKLFVAAYKPAAGPSVDVADLFS